MMTPMPTRARTILPFGAKRDGLLRCSDQRGREQDQVRFFARCEFFLNLAYYSEGELHPVAGRPLEFRGKIPQRVLRSGAAETRISADTASTVSNMSASTGPMMARSATWTHCSIGFESCSISLSL